MPSSKSSSKYSKGYMHSVAAHSPILRDLEYPVWQVQIEGINVADQSLGWLTCRCDVFLRYWFVFITISIISTLFTLLLL